MERFVVPPELIRYLGITVALVLSLYFGIGVLYLWNLIKKGE